MEKEKEDNIINLEATFSELTKSYNKIFARYAYIELAYFYDDVDEVNNYLKEMSKLHRMIYKKWEKTEAQDLKEDLTIMSTNLGELISISEKKWTTQ